MEEMVSLDLINRLGLDTLSLAQLLQLELLSCTQLLVSLSLQYILPIEEDF